MLILTRKAGQSFLIGDNIEITVTELSSDKVKIGIEAPKDICILRKELLQTMEENKQASSAASEGAVRLLAAKFPPKPPLV